MKILIATFSFPDPSIESFDGRFVLSEAVGYAENGASVLVLTPHYPGAPRDEQIAAGIRVYRFRYFLPECLQRLKIPGQPIYRARTAWALVQLPLLLVVFASKLIRFGRWADIIHAQWTVTALLALPAKWLFRTPIVVTARGSDIRLLPVWLNRFLHRQVDASLDCFRALPWSPWYRRNFPARFLSLPIIVDARAGTMPSSRYGRRRRAPGPTLRDSLRGAL